MKTQRKFIIVAILVAIMGLLTVSLAMAGSGDSLAVSPSPAVEQSGQMPPVATGGSITITHSADQSIAVGASVHCGTTGTPYHTPNSYIRVFDLATDFGITEDFDVTAVQYGIEEATGNGGTQPVDVNLYTLSGPLVFANLTPIGTQTDSVPDQSLSIFTSLVNGTVPAGEVLVVEVFTPDGTDPIFNSLYIGANGLGQTDPTYLAAADCGITQPTDTAVIGFPNMHFVLNVIGNEAGGGTPAIEISKNPITQTIVAGGNAEFTITVTNSGDVDLNNVTVTDAMVPACDTVIGDLTAGAVNSYSCTDVGVAASYTNVADVTSTIGTAAGPTASATADVTVVPPTSVSLSGFGGDGAAFSPVWLVALLAVVLGFGFAIRRKLTA